MLATAWADFDDQLTVHHTGEHEIAWPTHTTVGASPSLLAMMDAEHDSMAAASQRPFLLSDAPRPSATRPRLLPCSSDQRQ